ncbi:MAG: ornithine cyclodeaminase family protein [Pseudomonadota bacterium]|nr:ornithine cyclodeaminase family protein [Pseudomonadota bacterium]
MKDTPLWITEADVVSLIKLPEAIDALERTLALEATDKAASMPKTHLMVASNDAMHAIGGASSGEAICGFKTWINVQGKSQTTMTLFSMEDGACLGIIEATALGQMRTAAVTGVGTKWLSPKNADQLGIVGTGKQSLPQIAAVHAVRPLKEVRISSRNPETRRRFAENVTAELGIKTHAVKTPEEAVGDAPLVTLITNSTKAFLSSDMLTKGCHLNAMGAIVPSRVEFTDDVFDRADLIAVDSVRGVRDLSTEFRARYGEDDNAWKGVKTLASLISDNQTRPVGADVTLFKAMGMGLSDLALAIEVYKRAQAENRGQKMPERIKIPPRLI